MTFEPMNGEHAIQVVTFSASLTRRLSTADLNSVRSNHKRWRAELPATTSPQGFEMQIEPTSGTPQLVPSSGLEFSFLRPDGSSAWTLRLLGSEVSVDCFRYTRWGKTWERAHRYIQYVMEILARPDPEQQIHSFTLSFLDRFISDNTKDDPKQLLRASPILSSYLLEVGPLWHQHTGWFVDIDSGKILNQLNIDSKFEQSNLTETEKLQELVISIQHSQRWVLNNVVGIRPEIIKNMQIMDLTMHFMHEENKSVINKLLTPVTLERISFFPVVRNYDL